MEHIITLSLSIHYITQYGEELIVNFDNGMSKKMSWNTNHVWTVTLTIPPRSTRWWYSVTRANQIIRIEDLVIPREFDFDSKDRYFEVVDHWNEYFTSVTPIASKKLVSSKSMTSKLIKRYLIPRYQATLERRKSPIIDEIKQLPSTNYCGGNWGYFDEFALEHPKETKVISVYSLLRENETEQ
ncbi:hypothetical protein ENU1_178660 [Entamoeba nuttalli P19]|uniref:Uncharacterized protein n=2 Tax=Entamoeba nuttalli TaxID=412467 RepID=K2HQ42_ENTNP|nr:hypothetical protein ENU1_178660 [Entamoeba nuttalli P19]EKE38025.1 hypothetical protein ENU1_178660 [Entamoeba nuttalli P19]|eukprot:XP_008859630.1 hypothetical protein ENU1_178660 [Entamoeba nuttalli P19]